MKLNNTYSYVQTPAYKDDSINSFKVIRGWNVEYYGLMDVWWEARSYGTRVESPGGKQNLDRGRNEIRGQHRHLFPFVYEREIFGTDNKLE
jgi:hypothetical protein